MPPDCIPNPITSVIAILITFLSLSPIAAHEIITLNPDGAWCWFQDERALISGENLVVASIQSSGTIDVTTFDSSAHTTHIVPIKHHFVQQNGAPDDHNVAALLHREDGHFMAFYARHHADNLMHIRVSKKPHSALTWNPETTHTFGIKDHATYANPFQLSDENNRIYLFWRGRNFWPTFSTSNNKGATWTTAKNLLADPDSDKKTRPYAKYCTSNTDAIHVMYTDGHPRTEPANSIYHIIYRDGQLRHSDGTPICPLGTPALTTSGTRVYDGHSSTGKAWAWDITLDKLGNPVMAYASVPTIHDHRYRYATWNPENRQWNDQEIAHAGTGLYYREREYSGGITIDPDDPTIVYISSDVDPVTGQPNPSGKREITKGQTTDNGKTWRWTPITTNSTQDNIRPIVPRNHPSGTYVLWLQGTYNTYTDYYTAVMLAKD